MFNMKLAALVPGFVCCFATSFFGLFSTVEAARNQSPSPGIAFVLSKEGIELLSNFAVLMIQTHKDEVWSVPDHNGSIDVPVGRVDYALSEVFAADFDLDKLNVDIIPGIGVEAFIKDPRFTMWGKFNYNFATTSISTQNQGFFNFTVTGVRMIIAVTLKIAPDGNPIIEIIDCSLTLENVDIVLQSNRLNWLHDVLSGYLKNSLKLHIQDQICKSLKGKQYVLEWKQICLGFIIRNCIDMSLTSAPVFDKNFIQTSHVGEVRTERDRKHSPIEAPRLFKRTPASSSMFTIYFSTYPFNTFFHSDQRSGGFEVNKITKDSLDDDNSDALDTTCERDTNCISSVIPNLAKYHPGLSVELEVSTTSAPFLTISNNKSSIAIKADFKIDVREANGSLTTVGHLTTSSSVRVEVSVVPAGTDQQSFWSGMDRVVLVVKDVNLLSITSSDLPSDTDLNKLFDFIVSKFLLPPVNKVGNIGFPILNSDYVQYILPAVHLIDNAFVFTADAKLNHA